MVRDARFFGAAVGLLLLAGCAGPGPDASPTGGPSDSASPSPTPTEPPIELVFTMPTDCAAILPAGRQAAFAAEGRELLGGPGGRYEGDYFLEPTPEENVGGISCVWGDESDPQSTIIISVAPVNVGNRASIVGDLIAQGLNEVLLDDALTYGQIGDEASAPAILNVLRDDSWISVIDALGGDTRFDRATELVDEVAAEVYDPAG
jgi:hypothetical protein